MNVCLFSELIKKCASCSSLSGLWKGFKTNLNSLHVCKMQLLVFTAVWVRIALAVWNQSLVSFCMMMMWQTYLFFLPLIVWIKIDQKKITVFLKCICKILFMANVFHCFEQTETHADACRLILEDIRQRHRLLDTPLGWRMLWLRDYSWWWSQKADFSSAESHFNTLLWSILVICTSSCCSVALEIQ